MSQSLDRPVVVVHPGGFSIPGVNLNLSQCHILDGTAELSENATESEVLEFLNRKLKLDPPLHASDREDQGKQQGSGA